MKRGIVIVGEVGMGELYAVVIDADMDAQARELAPDALDVAQLQQMPLLGGEGILWQERRRHLVSPLAGAIRGLIFPGRCAAVPILPSRNSQ